MPRPGDDWFSLRTSDPRRDDVSAAYATMAATTEGRILIASVPGVDLDDPSGDDPAPPIATDLMRSGAAAHRDIEMLDSSMIGPALLGEA